MAEDPRESWRLDKRTIALSAGAGVLVGALVTAIIAALLASGADPAAGRTSQRTALALFSDHRFLSGLQVGFDLLVVAALGLLYWRARTREATPNEEDAPPDRPSELSRIVMALNEVSFQIERNRASDNGDAKAMVVAAAEQIRSEMTTRVEQALRTSADLEDRVRGLTGKSLEDYFKEWKERSLAEQRAGDVARTLAEFESDPETVKIVTDARLILARIREKTVPVISSLQEWIVSAPVRGVSGLPGFSRVIDDFRAFTDRGRELIEQGELLERELTPRAATFDFNADLTLIDVVSGRSAELLSRGYKQRLHDHLRQTEAQVQKLGEEVDKLLRTHFVQLLDACFQQEEALVPAGRLDLRFKEALAAAKIHEIAVEAERTRFNGADHEPLAGVTESRPDLPPNTIVRLDRRGYRFEGKPLRRARVVLSSSTAPSSTAAGSMSDARGDLTDLPQ